MKKKPKKIPRSVINHHKQVFDNHLLKQLGDIFSFEENGEKFDFEATMKKLQNETVIVDGVMLPINEIDQWTKLDKDGKTLKLNLP